MRRPTFTRVLLALLPLLAALWIPRSATAQSGNMPPHVPDEVIIKFTADATDSEKDQIRAGLGGQTIRGFGRIKAEQRKLGVLSVDDAIAQYRNHPKVEYIEPNYIVSVVETPNDPQFNQLWGMLNTGQTGGTPGADIRATNAWDVFTGSSQVLIGVIDTGVDYTHPDLAANIWTNPGEIPGNGIDDDSNGFVDDVRGWDFRNDDNDPMDDHGHGSHVSGTIGAVGNNGIGVAGVCWNVRILPLKFLSGSGSGTTADAVEAVEYATMMGAKLTSNSWGGGGFSQALFDAIQDANLNGSLFVAAAGNSGANADVTPHYPSSYNLPNIISVAATDHNDQLASFSNYGATSVDLAAPGVNILSTFPGNSYGSISGTSMATPHVSGALGLVFGRFPAIGHLDAKNLIFNFADPLPNLTGVVATGARLNAFLPIADPDSIPPGAIADVANTTQGSNWLVFGWTATGDDDATGTAARYIVKYSTSPIDAANFDAATTAADPPDPAAAGSPQSMRIDGLDFNTAYYVAVKALDEFGNASDISNVATGTTLGIPDIAAAPLSFSETLLSGATAQHVLSLSNVGLGTLDFEIPTPQLITNSPLVAEYLSLGKEEPDPRPGILGSGGPDGFGYRWVDSDEPGGPVFAWTDISGTGTLAMTTGVDINEGPFPIGFTFPFYGVEYDNFRICSNGWISFTSTSTAYSNQPLPNAGAPAAMIAPFWDDINITTSGDVHYQSDGSRLIVQWTNAAHYGSGGPYTFQVILSSDGTIEYQYLSMASPTNSATIGIQNSSRTDGLQVVFNEAYMHDSLVVRIAAVPQWVDVAPREGTIFAPNSTDLDVSFNSTGLLGGTYDATIQVLSNDPDESPFAIPVQLTVIGAPDIALAPTSIDYGQVFLGATPVEIVSVQNPGTDVLHVSSVAVDDAVYTLSPTSFDVPPRSSVNVEVTFSPVVVGSYPATLTVLSDDPDEPSVTVALTGAGVPPPAFSVSPTSLAANLVTGQSETQPLTLSNTGGADLEWSTSVEFVAAAQNYTLTVPEAGIEADGGTIGPDTRTTPIQAELADLTGIQIMFDRSHGQTTRTSWTTIISDWESRGATVTDNSDPITPALLAGYDVLWSVDTGSSAAWDPAELAAIAAWVSAGGGLLLEGDNTSSVEDYNELLTALGAGIVYSLDDNASGTTTNIHPHETTQGVTGIYLTAAVASIGSTTAPAAPLVDDINGVTNTAYSKIGAGRVIAAADEIFQNSRMSQADNQLFGNQVMDWLATEAFLTLNPTSGTVPPGGNQLVNANFDATGLFGGLYEANVVIATNDPLAPEVTVPAALQVTGAPDIVVDPVAIDFGTVYVGYPDIHEFEIRNAGTDQLTVTGIASSDPAFSIFLGAGSFPIQLAPLASTIVQARFSPPGVGAYNGVLTVNSNDPDTPAVPVSVVGSGLLPPIASVDPDSLHADLLTGQTDLQSFVLSNTGASDLDWSTQIQFVAAAQNFTLTVPEAGVEADGGTIGPDTRTTPIQAELADLTGIDIMFDRSHGQGTRSSWTTIIADLESRGATVTDNSDPITPALLAGYDVLWSVDTGSSAAWDPAELAAIAAWVNGGGGILLEGDNTSSVDDYNELLTYLAAGIEFSLDDNATGTTTNIYPHPTTEGVTGIYITAAVASIGSVTAPAGPLVDDINGVTNTAYSIVGAGRIIAAADELFQNTRMSQASNQLFGNQVFDWLASPVFVSVSPESGVLPPGGNTTVNVEFDAGGLFGGDYASIVRVLSNDPANGALDVDATLTVTGVPKIAFGAASVDFGDVFLGYPSIMTLTVTNDGTDLLSVSSVSAGLPDWSVDATSFDLAPLESRDLMVTFDPQAVGDRSTTLTFVSNDPGSPDQVALIGAGLLPPIASVDPDSVHADLLTGEIEAHVVTLSNTGASDLSWSTQLSFETPTQAFTLTAPDATGVEPDGGVFGPDARTAPIQADLADLTGVQIMFDRSHGQTTRSSWTTIIADWESRGATVTDNSDPLTPALLAGYDVLWSVDTGSSASWDPAELTAIANWVNAGGSILLEGDNTSSVDDYNELLAHLGAGIVFSDTDNATGTTPNIHPHPTTEGVTGIYLTAAVASIGSTTAPAGPLVDDIDGVTNTAYSVVGAGRIVAAADEIFQNSRMSQADNQLFGNQVMDWLATPVFLSVSPESGVVPAGGSVPVDVIYDATGLFGGDYRAAVHFLSNDPANGDLRVAATMHVTGVPRIAFEPASMTFGDAYIGYPEQQDVTVQNVGTDVLSVTSVTPGLPDWSVDTPSFDLNPFESRVLTVTFDPQAAGDRSSALAFASNDPDAPHDLPVSGNGVVPPVIAANPDTVEGAALPGGSKTKTLTVCNTGGSDLSFDVNLSAGSLPLQNYGYVEMPKGSDVPGGEGPADPRPGILGTGGPDAFGYVWTDSDEPGGPVFDWVDISAIGTPTDFPSYEIDGTYGPYPIGFDFPFYGNPFTEFYVCNNGWISFTNGVSEEYSNQPLPNSDADVPENMLAIWWDDNVYDEADGSYIKYHNDGSRLIIEYYVRRIAQSSPPFYRFQIILYPDGRIVYQYDQLGPTVNTSTIGIQNATKDDGLTVLFNDGSYPHDDLAIQFSAAPQWLSVTPTSGVVPAGECMDLTVTMDAAELEAGEYEGLIALASNDPATPVLETPVLFHVGSIDVADIDVDPDVVNLGGGGSWISAFVELPPGYAPEDIVVSTVKLNGVPASGQAATIGDFNSNGIPDRQFKFPRADVVATLAEGDSAEITVLGEIEDTIYFVGTTYIRVIHPQLVHPNGGEVLTAGAVVDVIWTNPPGFEDAIASIAYSSDDGDTWVPVADAIAGQSYSWQVPVEPTSTGRMRVYIYQSGQKVLGYDTSDLAFTITGAVTGIGDDLPAEYAMRFAAANPVTRGRAAVELALPEPAPVRLGVYDVRGALVKELVSSARLEAGRHRIEWDRTNRVGGFAHAGVYFVRATAGGRTFTTRFALLD